MLTNLKSALRRVRANAKARRDYHFLLGQSDGALRDMGVDRAGLYRAVVLGRGID